MWHWFLLRKKEIKKNTRVRFSGIPFVNEGMFFHAYRLKTKICVVSGRTMKNLHGKK
jgi:tmRNA-binding protein